MKIILSLLFILTSTPLQALTVTSLNIEWYGRGGSIDGQHQDEYRDSRLKEFLLQEKILSDVYVFQEITDPERLSELLKSFECRTYDNIQKRHQYVVICTRPELFIASDVDFDVQLGHHGLRPAMMMTIKGENGESVQIVGVHLKAGVHETKTRLSQVEKISQSDKLNQATKVLVIGDFNTFDDDHVLMEDIFNQSHLEGVEIPSYTYFGQKPRTLDRAWGKNINVKEINIFGPCQKDSVPHPFSAYDFYQRFISDHCALQVKF